MRRVSIVITCDVCEKPIEEEVEGASAIRFTIRGQDHEMDMCDECVHGSFLQEARSVQTKKRAKKGGSFACHCGSTFATDRGLRSHQTRTHG